MELVQANPGCPASLFGHCDPMGSDALNKTLGDRRVTAIYALLTRQVPLWEKLYSAPAVGDSWGTRAIQSMLQSIVDGNGNPYYSGEIDNLESASTAAAVKSFQSDAGLSADGEAGASTRKVLFGAYMDWLCTPSGGSTPFKMEISDFLGGKSAASGDTPKLSTQSYGKFNPILLLASSVMQGDREARNGLDAPNRRVMMFLFKAGTVVDPATWPCPPIGYSGDACKSAFWPDGDQRRTNGEVERSYKRKPDTMACRFYDRFARRSPCERGAFKIWLQDSRRQRMPYAPYRLTCGTVVRTGSADLNGLVTTFLNTAETSLSLQWGELPRPSDDAAPSSSGLASSAGTASASDAIAYLYARRIIINPEPPSPEARDYYNLYYLEGSDDENAQAFAIDYPSKTVDDVHGNGLPKNDPSGST